METLNLNVSTREILGKKTKLLRRKGITPTHLFGHSIKSLALECPTALLEQAIVQAGTTRLISLHIGKDKPRMVFIREIQRDPISDQLIHIDFYQVRMEEKITAEIPIVFFGEALALKGKGRILTQPISHLSVECLPHKLPSRLEVDLSPLEEMGNAIHVRDITLGADVTITTDPEQLVVKVGEVAAAKVEEEEEAAKALEEAGVAGEEEAGVAGEAGTPAEAGPPEKQSRS